MLEQDVVLGQGAEVGMIDQENWLWIIGGCWLGLSDRLLQHLTLQAESDHENDRALDGVGLSCDQRRMVGSRQFRQRHILLIPWLILGPIPWLILEQEGAME